MIKVNGDVLGVFTFPAGELQVKHSFDEHDGNFINNIEVMFEGSDDLVALMQLSEIFIRLGVVVGRLELSYLPFSRMDRPIDEYAFSLKVIADIINSFKAYEVITYDVHSFSASILIKNLNNIVPFNQQLKFIDRQRNDVNTTLLFPDDGAAKRYSYLIDKFNYSAYCYKKRDSNGVITDISLDEGSIRSGDVYIFDDICDGGATFIEIAKKIKPEITGKLYLFVTHGIFSKGLTELFKYYDVIACTDSFYDYNFADQHLPNFEVYRL